MTKTFVLGLLLALQGFIYAGTLEDGRYYTWHIPEPNVPVGSVITSVEITLEKLSTAVQVEGNGYLHVGLVRDPPCGWVGNDGLLTIGMVLSQAVSDGNDFTINLADVELTETWIDSIFTEPFSIACPAEDGFEVIRMNQAILLFNHYAGSGESLGLLLRAVGGKASLYRISVKVIMRAYTGAYSSRIEISSVNVPVDTTGIEAWAARERAKLMAGFLEQLKKLEERISAALGGE